MVREAHEAVELLIKGALRFVGIDPPRRHDPAPVLIEHLDRFPPAWRARAEEIREMAERLFGERGHAFYGDEADPESPRLECFRLEGQLYRPVAEAEGDRVLEHPDWPGLAIRLGELRL